MMVAPVSCRLEDIFRGGQERIDSEKQKVRAEEKRSAGGVGRRCT